MKKMLKTFVGLIGLTALFLGAAENPDGSCNLAWTLSCLAVFGGCAWVYSKLFHELDPDDNPVTYDNYNEED